MAKTYRHNGENWFCDDRSWFTRIRQWFVWIGGWEDPIRGWRFFLHLPYYRQWWKRWHLKSPAPLSLFGHRFTYYGWGYQFRVKKSWLVVSWCGHPLEIYISKDGTPESAHHWLWNPPQSVKKEAYDHQQELKKLDRLYAIKHKTN